MPHKVVKMIAKKMPSKIPNECYKKVQGDENCSHSRRLQ